MKRTIVTKKDKPVSRRVIEKTVVTEEFRIVGLQYAAGLKLYQKIGIGDALLLRREPNNAHDKFAVRVSFNGEDIGYVERDKSNHVAELLENFGEANCECLVSVKDDKADIYNKLKGVMYCSFYTGA